MQLTSYTEQSRQCRQRVAKTPRKGVSEGFPFFVRGNAFILERAPSRIGIVRK